MDKAIVISNGDIFLSWVYDQKIADCLGFAVYRTDPVGPRTPLPAWVGFKGGNNSNWVHKDTTVLPAQKFSRRDFTANRDESCTYEIVPMIGSSDRLQQPDLPRQLITDDVALTPKRGSFTDGILAIGTWSHAARFNFILGGGQ